MSSPESAVGVFTTAGPCQGRLRRHFAIGFALGTFHVSPALAAIVIGAVSISMSLIGLELGNRTGARTGECGELFGGLVLIGVGGAVASGVL